jgi:hypothetical protein
VVKPTEVVGCSLRLRESLRRQVEIEAKKHGRSWNALVVEILEKHFEKQERGDDFRKLIRATIEEVMALQRMRREAGGQAHWGDEWREALEGAGSAVKKEALTSLVQASAASPVLSPVIAGSEVKKETLTALAQDSAASWVNREEVYDQLRTTFQRVAEKIEQERKGVNERGIAIDRQQ